MILKQAIGGTLREIRLSKGLTLRQVSRKAYISLGFLSEVERGEKEIASELLDRIAETYSMDTEQLVKEIYEYLRRDSKRSNLE